MSASLGAAGVVACNSSTDGAPPPPPTSNAASAGVGGGDGGGGATAGGAGGGEQLEPADWSCVGNLEPYPSPTDDEAILDRTIEGFLTGSPLPDLTVKVCERDDTTCDDAIDEQITDAEGKVILTIPLIDDGFTGYFDIHGENIAWLSFTSRTLTEGFRGGEGIVSTGELNALAALVSTTVDPERGHMAVTVDDCPDGGDPVGVQIEVSSADGDTTFAYFEDGLPSVEATETDASGIVGVINVPPGPVTVTTKHAEDGSTIDTYELFVRKGTVSGIYTPPRP